MTKRNLLTMLTHPEPQWLEEDFIVNHCRGRAYLGILDLGYDLTQQSRTLAEFLGAKGMEIHLTFAHVPTARKEFLLWWGKRTGISVNFLDCTAASPLPPTDLCFALEFFEHVQDPLSYFEHIDLALTAGGLLITSIGRHHEDSKQASPKLQALRDAVRGRRYHDVSQNFIFSKPSSRSIST